MSFLKQNWFYIPAAIALACVVLLGILKLYSTINPIEPNTVSLSPQPSTEEPQHFTDGPATTTSVSTRDSQSTESTPQETPEEHVGNDTESHQAEAHSDDETTDETTPVARITHGPHKGMTVEEYREHAELMNRKKELSRRLIEYSKKEIALADALLKSADDELSAMLSVFALLSPEQREIVRQEALKTVPADQVETFFEDLPNHSTTRTPDQITKDAKEIIESRKVRAIIFEQLGVEFEQIKKELRESERNKP